MPVKYVAPTRPVTEALRANPGWKPHRCPLLLAAALAWAPACSESKPPAASDGGGTASPVAITALTTEIAGVFCAQMRRCCSAADLGALAPALQTAIAGADCPTAVRVVAYLNEQFNLGRLRQSVEMGRATFDPQQAGACVAHLRGLSCPVWTAVRAGQPAALGLACQNMVRGTAADGTACVVHFEHECQSGSCTGTGATALCGPAPRAGQACAALCTGVFDCTNRCTDQLLCSPDGMCATSPAPRPTPQCDGT
jgi:hypothetical protein